MDDKVFQLIIFFGLLGFGVFCLIWAERVPKDK